MQPPPEAIEQVKLNPNRHVYMIEGQFGPDDAVPPSAIKGAWKVDASGTIIGDLIPNPKYVRKPSA
jgi:hypothetical protein